MLFKRVVTRERSDHFHWCKAVPCNTSTTWEPRQSRGIEDRVLPLKMPEFYQRGEVKE